MGIVMKQTTERARNVVLHDTQTQADQLAPALPRTSRRRFHDEEVDPSGRDSRTAARYDALDAEVGDDG